MRRPLRRPRIVAAPFERVPFAGDERRAAPRTRRSDYAWRLRLVAGRTDWRVLELTVGVHAALWGAWMCAVWGGHRLLMWLDHFLTSGGWADRIVRWLAAHVRGDVMASNPAYGPFRYVVAWTGIPASLVWGLFALGVGALSLWGLAASRQAAREAGALGIGAFWCFAATCYVWAEWRTTATVSVPLYAACALYVHSRLVRGAYARDVQAAHDRALFEAWRAGRDAPAASGAGALAGGGGHAA